MTSRFSMSEPRRHPGGAALCLAAGAALGALALLVVHVVLRDTFWNTEEGVYALTARLLDSGHSLYRDVAAAQPPLTYLVGAGLLAIHDGLEWLRLAVACLQLGASLMAGQVVWRITGSVTVAAITPAVMMLAPWAVHEHGALTPELVALPLLMGALLAGHGRRTTPLAGVLCGLLPLVKLPEALPALALILTSREPRRVATWAVSVFVAGAIATFAWGGQAVWRDMVLAQTQSGTHSLAVLKGWWGQAAWNLAGPVVGCLVALRLRRFSRDPMQLRGALATAFAAVLMLLSTVKQGTGLNVTVPVEAALLPGALSGLALAVGSRGRVWTGRRGTVVLAAAAIAFPVAQGSSLLVSPTDPQPFLRAGSSQVGWAAILTRPQFRRQVRSAQACPAGSFYVGPTLIAFAARRRVPDDQADGFITATPALRAVQRQMSAARPVCG
jgi:hypothetical protein